MRIAALYVCWDDWDLLHESYKRMGPLVDGTVVIYSNVSNFGEQSTELPWDTLPDRLVHNYEPDLRLPASQNERNKRNFGLDLVRKMGYTHFIILDADEVYQPEAFLKEKDRFKDPNLNGLVCGSKVYFKTPELTIGMDTTRVPFIHKITEDLFFDNTTHYPFSYDGKDPRIDPTRRLSYRSGIQWSDIVMHHFSYIRKDLRKKIRNSTATKTLTNSAVLEDYQNAADGYFCKMYGKTLHKCENIFNMPQIIDNSL